MNLKKYFNWKIVVGLIIIIIGIILWFLDMYTTSLMGHLMEHLFPLIILLITFGLIILIWGRLEKAIERMGKSKKILNIVAIAIIVLLGFWAIIEFFPERELDEVFPDIPDTKILNETKSISEVRQLCIINNGHEFNDQCEDMLIEMKNLYLYPVRHPNVLDYLYLYNSNTYSTHSDSINSDTITQTGNFITVRITENTLLSKIQDKLEDLEEPISVNIKGRIKSTELCTQNSPCKFGLIIILDDITYNEPSKDDGYSETNSDIYRNEEYGFKIENLGNFKYEEGEFELEYFNKGEEWEFWQANEEWKLHKIPVHHIKISTEDNSGLFIINIIDLNSINVPFVKSIMHYAKHEFTIDGIKGFYHAAVGDNTLSYVVIKDNYQYEIFPCCDIRDIEKAEKMISNFKFINTKH
jgi:hypothetical protein